VDPFDPDVASVLRAGVTAVFVSPPEGPGVNGTGLALRVRPASPDAVAIEGEGAVAATLGAGSGRDAGPISRISEVDGIVGLLRTAEQVRKAADKYAKELEAYEKKRKAWEKAKAEAEKKAKEEGGKAAEEGKEEPPKEPEPPTPPPPNPMGEALVPVLDRSASLRVRADAAEDLLSALSILDAFDVRLVLVGAGEAPRVLDPIACARVAVLVGPLAADDPAEAADPTLPKRLADAGVPFALATFSRPGRASRFLPLHAAAAARGGLAPDRALRAVTLDAARLAGVAGRLGSLTPGKDADVVLWTGHPVDTRSRAVRVLLGGETAWEERP
jgi:imidazolonepropionase-like amidohydrolase